MKAKRWILYYVRNAGIFYGCKRKQEKGDEGEK